MIEGFTFYKVQLCLEPNKYPEFEFGGISLFNFFVASKMALLFVVRTKSASKLQNHNTVLSLNGYLSTM